MKILTKMGRWIAIGLAVFLLLPPVATTASEVEPTPTVTRDESRMGVSARWIDGRYYVSLADFANSVTDATYSYQKSTGYATLKAKGLYITAGNGGTFITANDRPLYGAYPNRMIGGTLWVPLSVITKAMGVKATVTNGSVSITGTYRPLTPGSEFYRSDEVYWLSRIISAESRGESLRGQMAVGNVVLNRVRHPSYPNTIYGVIFQKWQFTPTANGTIYETPTWLSTVVAKMCLEGYSINTEALFFCNPASSTSHWVENNRPFAFRLGKHSFFY